MQTDMVHKSFKLLSSLYKQNKHAPYTYQISNQPWYKQRRIQFCLII